MDLTQIRTFLAVAEAGQLQLAATKLLVTQQAVSKRLAALEEAIGVKLFVRNSRGAALTADGAAFFPHAQAISLAAKRALDSIHPGRRALRVDVVGAQLGTAKLVRDFHLAHPDLELDVMTRYADADSALAAVSDGTVDATFRAISNEIDSALMTMRVLDDPVEVLVSGRHSLARLSVVTPADLKGTRIWMPFIVPGTEWAEYYEVLARSFGLAIDTVGPDFGMEAVLETVASSPTLATLVGENIRLVWPADHDLRRIPVRGPKLVYPHCFVWRKDNPHPTLNALRTHVYKAKSDLLHPDGWVPGWPANRK